MTLAVIDASVLTYALLAESGLSLKAIAACEQFDEWIAPHIVDVECLSAWRSMVRRGESTAVDAQRAVAELAAMPMDRYDSHLLGGRMWELQENVTAHDAAYVALAEALDVPLVTCNARLARATGPRCDFVLVGGRHP